MSCWLPIAVGLAPGVQKYLSQARRMQALSFAAHMPAHLLRDRAPTLLLSVEW